MYFKKEGAYEYLVKTAPDNRQSRLGPRDEKAEATLHAFVEAIGEPPKTSVRRNSTSWDRACNLHGCSADRPPAKGSVRELRLWHRGQSERLGDVPARKAIA